MSCASNSAASPRRERPYAAFAVPLGSTTKMDGCAAIYPAIVAIFVAQFYQLPLAGVGLLLAIDPILDMGRTAVNVAGQALVPVIVAKRRGLLDQARYDRARGIDELDVDARPASA